MVEWRAPWILLALVLWMFARPDPVIAQPAEVGDQPIVLNADLISYATAKGVVTAVGNVELNQEGRTLLTDRIAYDIESGTVTAQGNIILIEPSGDAVFADELMLDDRLTAGFVESIGVLLKDGSRIAAVKGLRKDGRTTTLDRAVYSPCEVCAESDNPLWQIKAERVVHDQATGTIAYRNARLEVAGVPVLYTPYFYHPDPSVERRTGFLVPSFGTDSELGFTVETPFFIDLAPNRDITLVPLLTSQAGVFLAGEYRDLQSFGLTELGGGITYTDPYQRRNADGQTEQASGDEVRGFVEGRGRYVLSERDRAGFDLNLASDNTVLERYNISNDDVLQNHAYLERFDGRDYYGLNTYGFQTLRENDDQDEIPIALPLAETKLYSDRLLWGSQADWSTNILGLTRDEGLDTRRFSSEVGWHLPGIGRFGDVWSLRLSTRADVYNTDGDPQTGSGDGGDNTAARLVPIANLDWGLPLVGQTGSWSHLIEPRVSFNYTPGNLNDSDIPNEDSQVFEFDETNLFKPSRFTGIDRVESGARVSYGLGFNSLGPEAWRISGLVGQSLRSGPDDLYPQGSGLEDPLSDFVGRFDVRPSELLDLGYRFRADKSTLALRRSDLSLAFGPPRLRFDIQYLRLTEEVEEIASEDLSSREEIVAGLRLQVLDSLAIGVRTRRDLKEDRTVTNQYGLVYTNPCLVLVAGLEQNFTEKGELDDEVSFTVRISLRSLGDLNTSQDLF